MRKELTTYGEEETRREGRMLAEELPGDALVAFSGDLGTGKTAFIRGMCDAFGCAAQVSSPSFTIINEYRGTREVAHCDLYRLETVNEMLAIGLDDLFASARTVLVEWAERALPLLPLPRYEIAARHGAEHDQRHIVIQRIERPDESSILFAPAELTFRRTP